MIYKDGNYHLEESVTYLDRTYWKNFYTRITSQKLSDLINLSWRGTRSSSTIRLLQYGQHLTTAIDVET